jgi:hypothetical protein
MSLLLSSQIFFILAGEDGSKGSDADHDYDHHDECKHLELALSRSLLLLQRDSFAGKPVLFCETKPSLVFVRLATSSNLAPPLSHEVLDGRLELRLQVSDGNPRCHRLSGMDISTWCEFLLKLEPVVV